MTQSTNGQKMAIIEAGSPEGRRLIMLHGGPGYFWLAREIEDMAARLSSLGHQLHILALQGRGCGVGAHASPYQDLTDDSLFKRAGDLKGLAPVDILLGHSTGAMVALTSVMENFIKPAQVILLSPYSASLGEHEYWITVKAHKYPVAFGRFFNFMRLHWLKYKGPLPADFSEKLYIYWGNLFFALPGELEKVAANLHYLDFHLIDCEPLVGQEGGEGYTKYKPMLDGLKTLEEKTMAVLLRTGTINAHWWRTNFQDGYPFMEKLAQARFDCPIHVLSGAQDEITPPHTVEKFAALLGTTAHIAEDARHLPETAMPGRLKEALIRLLHDILQT
jgi:pimeloyl-ACP methyl ester carboxylesterase